MAGKVGFAAILLAVVTFLLAGCGGKGTTTAQIMPARFELLAATLEEQLRLLEAPDGTEIELWNRLVARLEAEIETAGTARRPAGVPEGPGSEVDDLQVFATGGDPRLRWTYTNPGDCDLNGEVNAADLVPIAVNFNVGVGDGGWAAARPADADGNGEVNLGDVTVIAVHFNSRVAGYRLEFSPGYANPEDWPDSLETVPYSASFIENNLRVFDQQISHSQSGLVRVTPVDSLDESAAAGSSGNVSIFVDSALPPGDWSMPGHDRRHTSQSAVEVAEQYGPLWTTRLVTIATGSDYDIENPVVDADGNIYVGGDFGIHAVDAQGGVRWSYMGEGHHWTTDLIIAPNGSVIAGVYGGIPDLALVALDPADGSEIWKIDCEELHSSPVVGPAGRIYLYTEDSLRCYSQLGEELWRYEYEISFFRRSPPSVDDNGWVFALTNLWAAIEGYESPGMIALDSRGRLRWAFDLEDHPGTGEYGFSRHIVQSPPLILPDGGVVLQTSRAVHCYTPLGQLRWEFSVDQDDRKINGGIVLTGNGLLAISVIDPEGSAPQEIVRLSSEGGIVSRHQIAETDEAFLGSSHAGGGLLFNSAPQKLTALDGAAARLWQLDPQLGTQLGDQVTSYCLRDEGSLIVANSGELYCFAAGAPLYQQAPESVSASQGEYVDHVTVSWSPVQFAQSYVLHRSDRIEPLTILNAEALDPLEYDDYFAPGTDPLEYTVSVATPQGEGSLSSPAKGWLMPSGLNNPGAGDWAQPRHDQRQNSQSAIRGPADPKILWTWEYEQRNPDAEFIIDSVPVCSSDGTVYISTENEQALLSISPEGSLNWRYNAGYFTSNPVVTADGNIVVYVRDPLLYDIDGNTPPDFYRLVSLRPDRTVNWVTPIPGYPTQVAADPAGNLYFSTYDYHNPPDKLIKCNPAGNLTVLNGELESYIYSASAPAIDDSGNIYLSLLLSASIYNTVALDSTGQFLWEENDASFCYGAIALGNNNEVYSGTFPPYRYGASGEILWETNQYIIGPYLRVIVGPDDNLIVGFSSGSEHLGKLGRISPDGEVVQVLDLPDNLASYSSLIVDRDNNIYAVSWGGEYALGIDPDGNIKWQVPGPAGMLFDDSVRPALRDDGVLVVATQTGLVALGD